ncbi:MAG: PEGA domain-containing protein [Pontiellaceae bacterium]|nr:PEGA domain-containing protein [Pontiellaceae bacterium]MBN2784321.1 PEGA domain-containing protein [Pontiellaceae bacterium]
MTPFIKRLNYRWIIVFAAALMAVGCGEKKGMITISSSPSGAEVLVNGEPKGVTPLTLPSLLRGQYLIELQMAGHEKSYESVALLGGQHQSVDVELAPITGLLLVESKPQGAEVMIDGVSRGITPLLISDLPLGAYRLDFKSALHLPQTLEVELTDRVPKKKVAELVSNTATLVVDSDPSGANVLIDGVVRGVTPAVIQDVVAGSSEVTVAKTGYTSYTRNMEMKATLSYELKATLEALPSALNVTTVPAGAPVRIDGAEVGVTPLLVNVRDGMREIEIEMMGYDTVVTNLNLAPNVTERLDLRLVKNSGTLVLDTEPASVRIYLDGKLFGSTEPKGGADTISKSVTLLLKAGVEHTIQLVREGYAATSFTLDPELDQIVTRHEVLKRIFVRDTMITTKSEVIKCRLEYKLPNGNIYYERFPGVYDTAKAADIVKVQAIGLDDESNRDARRLIEQNRQVSPEPESETE